MKPSDIVLASPIPLTDTFGKTEVEAAAACLVLTMQKEDKWVPVAPQYILCAIKNAPKEHRAWIGNPYYRPNFFGLVDRGFATFTKYKDKGPLAFTEAGLKVLESSRWNKAKQES